MVVRTEVIEVVAFTAIASRGGRNGRNRSSGKYSVTSIEVAIVQVIASIPGAILQW